VTVFVSSPQGRAVHAERITLHGARHSFVTNLLAAGVPMATVSKLAGHASVAFTVEAAVTRRYAEVGHYCHGLTMSRRTAVHDGVTVYVCGGCAQRR